jgi:hypothetical protein
MDEEQRDERGPVSWESFNWMRQEIIRLTGENAQLQRDVDLWQWQANHWYMKANYSPEKIAEFERKRAQLDVPTNDAPE